MRYASRIYIQVGYARPQKIVLIFYSISSNLFNLLSGCTSSKQSISKLKFIYILTENIGYIAETFVKDTSSRRDTINDA